jgi:hypothetical protein
LSGGALKRFAKSFYSKTPLLKTDASCFVSVSAERSEKLSGGVQKVLKGSHIYGKIKGY